MSIRVEKLYRHFGNFTALDGVSLDFPSGELVALLGPSGCGKTTLLRVIAGLERADSGSVYLDGEEASSLDIRERHVGFVFQHYALFRHMTVFENVAFGLRAKRRKDREPEPAIRARVMRLLELVQLDWCAHRYPNQLSGGQRQRIALARALATQPRVLLLDEPFGALDAKVRKELRRWLRRLHDELHVTSLFVTHDQEEALEVADRVVLMNRGAVEQVGTPEAVYDRPATPFVYNFLGSVNRFEGRIEAGRLSMGEYGFSLPNGWGDTKGETTTKGFSRPHELELLPDVDDGDGLPAVIDRILAVGPTARIELQLADGGEQLLEAELPRSQLALQGWREGDRVRLRPRDIHFFAERSRPAAVDEPAVHQPGISPRELKQASVWCVE